MENGSFIEEPFFLPIFVNWSGIGRVFESAGRFHEARVALFAQDLHECGGEFFADGVVFGVVGDVVQVVRVHAQVVEFFLGTFAKADFE